MKTRRQSRLRTTLCWLGAPVLLALLSYGVMCGLLRHWVAVPPALESEPPITRLTPQQHGERVHLGSNWFARLDGLNVLYLTGDPFEMGYANGALTQHLIDRQEETLLRLLTNAAPSRPVRFLLQFFVAYKNRHLPDHLSLAHQLEIYGISRGSRDPHPEVGPYYHRILNYHAAQDISYLLMNSPLLRRGCTGFGAWGTNTADGHLLTGRNFDWEAAPVFDRDRVLILCEPREGIPFISLAWAGMVGAVSGLNRAGVSITLNGAPSNLPGDTATPTCMVVRDVLQRARNLTEAVQIIRASRVFVSAMFLVGSRADGRFIVVEKTPDQTALREAAQETRIVCANHYLTPDLRNTPLNRNYLEADTSVPRYERMQELLVRWQGRLTAKAGADLLRDRQLTGDRFAGNGHRAALNPLIATHSVLMDVTAGVFWASTAPHQLGRFHAFRVDNFEGPLRDLGIEADPLLGSGEYDRFQQALQDLQKGWLALKAGKAALALEFARSSETNNPGFYRNAWLAAESLVAQGRMTEARDAAKTAAAGSPALGFERAKLRVLVELLERDRPDQERPGASPSP